MKSKIKPLAGALFVYSVAGVAASGAFASGTSVASAGASASGVSGAGSSLGWFLRSLSACLATAFLAVGSLYHLGSLTPFFSKIKATLELG